MLKLLSVGFAVIASILVASTANALSCLQPDMASSFQRFSEADELYRVYQGRWRALEPVPDTTNNSGRFPSRAQVRYQFIGQGVGLSGPDGVNQRINVTVQPQCVGSWCAGYPRTDANVIVFVEDVNQDARTLRFEESACGGSSFPATRTNMQALVNCMNGVNCASNHSAPPAPPAPPTGDSCGADGPVSEYIGERVERVPFDLWPTRVRFVRPGDIVTMDYKAERLNVTLSQQAIIQNVRCG